MRFIDTIFAGAYLIEGEAHTDTRGHFSRTFCRREFDSRGLDFNIVQSSLSFNKIKGTVRGLHYQTAPHEESKLIRCTRGAIFDVLVDLRPKSSSYRRWQSFELSAENERSLYVPKGLAHGFQTLVDEVEVSYQMSEFYYPECAAGICWDDPELNISWPISSVIISERDKSFLRLASESGNS